MNPWVVVDTSIASTIPLQASMGSQPLTGSVSENKSVVSLWHFDSAIQSASQFAILARAAAP